MVGSGYAAFNTSCGMENPNWMDISSRIPSGGSSSSRFIDCNKTRHAETSRGSTHTLPVARRHSFVQHNNQRGFSIDDNRRRFSIDCSQMNGANRGAIGRNDTRRVSVDYPTQPASAREPSRPTQAQTSPHPRPPSMQMPPSTTRKPTRFRRPAGSIILPRCSTESLPIATGALGEYRALSVGQLNQGRSSFQEYPSTQCCKCQRKVNKYKVYAKNLVLNKLYECFVIFEIADANNCPESLFGKFTSPGNALIKMVTTIQEKVDVSSHPHLFTRNQTYCLECLAETPVTKDLSNVLCQRIKNEYPDAHFVRLPPKYDNPQPPALQGPFYARVPSAPQTLNERRSSLMLRCPT